MAAKQLYWPICFEQKQRSHNLKVEVDLKKMGHIVVVVVFKVTKCFETNL